MSLTSALSGLSTACQGSITSLLTSNFASCANVIGLANVAASSGSIVSPLNSWITSVCTSSPCSTSDLSSANKTLYSGCSTDLSSGQLIPSALSVIIGQYDGVRDLLCTKYISNNTYCIPQTLSAAQNATGVTASISQLTSLVSGKNTSNFLSSIPSSVYCTDCGHAITTEALRIVNNVQPSVLGTVQSVASGKCGTNFVNGAIPSTVQTTATGNTSTTSTAAGAQKTGNTGFSRVSIDNKSLLAAGTFIVAIAGTMASL